MDIRFEPQPVLAPGARLQRAGGAAPSQVAALAGDAVELRLQRGQDGRSALLRELRETAAGLGQARDAGAAVAGVADRLAGLDGVVEALGALEEEPDAEQLADLQALLDGGVEALDRHVATARSAGRGLIDGERGGAGALRVDAAGVRLALPDLGASALGLEGLQVDDPHTAEALRAARERVDEVRDSVEAVIERLQLTRRRLEQKLDELARSRAPEDPERLAQAARGALLGAGGRGALVHGLLGAVDAAGLLARPAG